MLEAKLVEPDKTGKEAPAGDKTVEPEATTLVHPITPTPAAAAAVPKLEGSTGADAGPTPAQDVSAVELAAATAEAAAPEPAVEAEKAEATPATDKVVEPETVRREAQPITAAPQDHEPPVEGQVAAGGTKGVDSSSPAPDAAGVCTGEEEAAAAEEEEEVVDIGAHT